MRKKYQDLMHLGFNEVAAKALVAAARSSAIGTVEQIAERLGISVEELYREIGREQAKEPR